MGWHSRAVAFANAGCSAGGPVSLIRCSAHSSEPGRQSPEAVRTVACSRRPFLAAAGFAITLPLLFPGRNASANAADTAPAEVKALVEKLKVVRDLLKQNVPGLVKQAKWDSVRTLLSKSPTVDVKDDTKRLIELVRRGESSGTWQPGDAGIIGGMREDILSSLKGLDAFSYTNVFIDESRAIMGTKVDFDTPMAYLQESLDAIDTLLDFMTAAQD